MSEQQVYIHLGNSETGVVGFAGPFAWVQLTYNTLIRVEEDGADDREVGWFHHGMWEMEDGSVWTDLTVSTKLPDEVTPICDICGGPEDQDPTNGREYDWNGETGNHLSCEREVESVLSTGIDYSDAVATIRGGKLCFICAALDGAQRPANHGGLHGVQS